MAKVVALILISFLLSLITDAGPILNAMDPPSWQNNKPIVFTVKQY